MFSLKKSISLLLVPALLLLTACTALSIRREGNGDPEFTGHPLCGSGSGDPCEGFEQVTFRIYANSEIFYAALEPTQNYLAEVMPAKIAEIFGEEARLGIVSIPFTTEASNYYNKEVIVRILFSTYPEDMLPPMVNLLISSENVLATDHAICSGEPGSASFCLEDLQTLLQDYFTPKNQ